MTEPTSSTRLVHVEHVWDTVVSLRLHGTDRDSLDAARTAIVAFLHHVDDVLSAYRPDSELVRWQRGDVAPGPDLSAVLAIGAEAERISHGHFDLAWNGLPDPTGIVKGWAVDCAAEIAEDHGIHDLMISAGGDLTTRGSPEPGVGGSRRPWRSGVVDPQHQQSVIAIVEGRRLDLATSGPSERGEHIRGPHARTVRSASVLGPDCGPRAGLAMTDALATAAVAAGRAAPDLLTELDAEGWRSQLVLLDGGLWRSPNWPSIDVGPARSRDVVGETVPGRRHVSLTRNR